MTLKLKQNSLDWALTHIERYGDTNIFPRPFEYKAISENWVTDLKPFLMNSDILNWKTRSERRCLTPKHRYGFRIATQLDPLDAIIFTALVGEIGKDIENSRLPKRNKIAFSNRFKVNRDGQMFEPDWNYKAFLEHSIRLSGYQKYNYIVLADVADFFPRIYSHPLENALSECTSKSSHVTAIKRLLKNWNFTISLGIPVGIQISMLLAELVLDDVDRGLLDNGAKHCRYVDDFRIFCKTKIEAHEQLALLAKILYENHALTLQQNKTMILPMNIFRKRFLLSEKTKELKSLKTKFDDLIKKIGVDDPYEDINYEKLDVKQKKQLDELNLLEIIKEQTKKRDIDIPLIRFIIRRFSQFDDINGVNYFLNNIDRLYPVFKDIIKYIQELRTINKKGRKIIGGKVLKLLKDSLVGHLEFHRLWIFNTFTNDFEWDNEDKFVSLYKKYTDSFSRREIILALGRARKANWFKTEKKNINSLEPWQKRAFIAAASCLPGDEYKHWFNSIKRSLDPLEKAVGNWIRNNPF
ncbi:MAG: RNA-directed DNA polymerase [Ignavibacteria bacterium]|nr:RNA-directed DNA polymerase [Ignavibacteria bacterium]